MTLCDVMWGSHGCDLPAGHEAAGTDHRCGDADDPCSELRVLRSGSTGIRHALFAPADTPYGHAWTGEWSPWQPFPYAFRLDGTDPLPPTVVPPNDGVTGAPPAPA